MADPNADENPQETAEMSEQQIVTILQSLSEGVVSDKTQEMVVDSSIKNRVIELFTSFQTNVLEVAGGLTKINTDMARLKEGAQTAAQELSSLKNSLRDVFNAQSEYIKQLTNTSKIYIEGAKEFALNLRNDGLQIARNYKENGLILASSIYDVVLKQKETIGTMMESTGVRHSIDNILAEHEKIIYLLLQKASAHVFLEEEDANFIGPDLSDAKIREVVTKLVEHHKEEVLENDLFMHHIKKLFETFYLNKLGKSLIQPSSVITSGSNNNVYIPRNNEDFIEKFRVQQLQSKIQYLTTDKDELIAFLSSLVNDIHNEQNYNHSKYFGSSVNIETFVRNAIGDDSIAMAEYNYRMDKTKEYVEFYLTNIAGKGNSTGSSLKPGGRYSKTYDSIQKEFMDEVNSITDFVNREYTTGYAAFEPSGQENPNKVDMLKSMLETITIQKSKVENGIANMKAELASNYEQIQKRIADAKQTEEQKQSDRDAQREKARSRYGDEGKGHNGGGKRKTRRKKRSHKKRKTSKKRKTTKKKKSIKKRNSKKKKMTHAKKNKK
jgi:hypothetical protein